MQELLEKNPGLTAVFSANDFMAMGAVKAIKERGMQVPNDIAIVGFDNQEFTEFVEGTSKLYTGQLQFWRICIQKLPR